MNRFHIRELVDMARLQVLVEDLYRLTGFPLALLDTEENILVGVGWQDICTLFHRVHPETLVRCRESDSFVKSHIEGSPEGFVDYRCQNGLRDVAMPIIIDGRHMATFFTGQFFYDDDPPDRDFFRAQAKRFGFDEAEYLKALSKVPIGSREHIRNLTTCCCGLVRMIAETGLKNLRLAQEVEKRKKSEKEADFFRHLVEKNQDPVYVIDPDDGYRMVYVNEAACVHFGLDREEILKMRIPDWDPIFDMSQVEALQRLVREQGAVRIETLHRVASGALVPVEVTIGYIEYEGRRLSAGHFLDITERKAMEAALKESEHNLTEAQRIAKVGNWSWSLGGRLLNASVECRRITGLSPEEFVGTDTAWLEVIDPDDRERVRNAYAHLAHNHYPCSMEYSFRRPDGKTVTVHEERELVFDDRNQPVRIVGTLQDITRQRKLAEALREKDLLLLQQSRMAAMGEMMSYIAHQWRQPLNIISLLVQNLEFGARSNQNVDSCRKRTVEQVMDLIDHMSSTINDFRDFFRTDKVAEPFDLKQTICKTVDLISADLAVHEIELDLLTEEGLVVLGHANEFSHVVLNILNNARDVLLEKETVNPRIQIRLFREGASKVVTIRDNAGGIPDNLREYLFDAYFTTKKGGTGIGLYISKVIMEKRFNGSLSVRNVEGGAEFRLEI